MNISRGAISEEDSKMPAMEEGEGEIRRALVSPLKRKTGGIIEMWITDESYTSPVKGAKVLESLDIADDLNLDEEKVEQTEEMLNGTVDSSCSSSVNISDLLESSADPDVGIGVGGGADNDFGLEVTCQAFLPPHRKW